jgi:hypothetical protein
MAVRWPTGGSNYFAYSSQYWSDFRNGRLPLFVKGVRFEYVPNNGSREWKELREKAKKGTVFSEQRIL